MLEVTTSHSIHACSYHRALQGIGPVIAKKLDNLMPRLQKEIFKKASSRISAYRLPQAGSDAARILILFLPSSKTGEGT